VSSELSQNQGDLVGILEELPANDSALPDSVRNGFLQLYENIIICGVPNAVENQTQPADTCAPTTATSATSNAKAGAK
jgi:hypothetical protein